MAWAGTTMHLQCLRLNAEEQSLIFRSSEKDRQSISSKKLTSVANPGRAERK
jgi:hypothetical protein